MKNAQMIIVNIKLYYSSVENVLSNGFACNSSKLLLKSQLKSDTIIQSVPFICSTVYFVLIDRDLLNRIPTYRFILDELDVVFVRFSKRIYQIVVIANSNECTSTVYLKTTFSHCYLKHRCVTSGKLQRLK